MDKTDINRDDLEEAINNEGSSPPPLGKISDVDEATPMAAAAEVVAFKGNSTRDEPQSP